MQSSPFSDRTSMPLTRKAIPHGNYTGCMVLTEESLRKVQLQHFAERFQNSRKSAPKTSDWTIAASGLAATSNTLVDRLFLTIHLTALRTRLIADTRSSPSGGVTVSGCSRHCLNIRGCVSFSSSTLLPCHNPKSRLVRPSSTRILISPFWESC